MQRSAWVEKRSSAGLGIPKRRFLVLLQDRLVYFKQQPASLADVHLQQPYAAIALASIIEVKSADQQQQQQQQQQAGAFLVVTDGKTYTMKCESQDDASLWVKAVSSAKHHLAARGMPAQKTSNVKWWKPQKRHSWLSVLDRLGLRDGEPDGLTQEQLDAISVLEQCVLDEHNVPHIPQTVLETLKRMGDRSARIDFSRSLGTALALWLHDDETATLTVAKHNDILKTWLQTALIREYAASCNFHGNVALQEAMPGHGKVMNTPFRGETAEVNLIVAFLREVSQRSGLLGEWLMPALMSVAADPEGHVFPRRSARHLSSSASAPPSCPDSPASETISEATDCTDAQDAKAEWSDTSSAKQDDSDCDTDSVRESSDAPASGSVEEIPNSENDEVVSKLTHVCKLVFKGLEQSTSTMPAAMRMLMHAIAKLTVSTKAHDQPEYQVYFASMSALIFLRLICPAFIAPIEWGALSTKARADILSVRKETNGSPEPRHRSLSSDMSMFMPATPVVQAGASEQERAGAMATVILLAYILKSGQLHLWWSGGAEELQDMERAILRVCELIPIEKAYALMGRYVEASQPLDNATTRTFESKEMRKSLVNIAKILQRLANYTSFPEDQLRNTIHESQGPNNLWSHPQQGDDTTSPVFITESVQFLKSWFTTISMQ